MIDFGLIAYTSDSCLSRFAGYWLRLQTCSCFLSSFILKLVVGFVVDVIIYCHLGIHICHTKSVSIEKLGPESRATSSTATLLMHPRFLDRSLIGLLHHLSTESQSVGRWCSILAYFTSLTLKYKLASTDSLYVCGYLSRSLTSLTFTGSTNGGSAPDQYVKSMVKDRRI
jgi:hypothetical protein